MTESCHFAPGYPINQILNVRGRWDMTKEITATKPLLKHTWMLNVSVNRRRFDWELSGEIMVRNRECLRLGKSAIFHSRYSKWKLVAICLKWEIKDVASVLLLVKQTFVSFPYKTSPSHKSKDLVQSRLSIQALINDLWEAWEKTEATYIYLYKHYIHNKNRPQKKKKISVQVKNIQFVEETN